ncbi:MAG: NAD-dependent succinate-semialdehyde dehydrogenase [Proteobacteria bacterium]|nr:NAD-dependent succinate-semialdehyde dehydrogenase [Pseudomonadota bacterium]
MYQNTLLHIGGHWRLAAGGDTIPVVNPATEEVVGTVAHATTEDLAEAAAAAKGGFAEWRKISPYDRSKVMRRAAVLMRERESTIARLMTIEQGKPLNEALIEVRSAADVIEWFAEEGRRTYGRVIPARGEGIYQLSLREPVGPVAAFTPWNFPINQIVRKLSAALAAGCSIIVKAPEEAPASASELIRSFVDAGAPAGTVNLVFGTPAEISQYLIAHPAIRKISFTGSTPVGKQLAALAGLHMKRATMELGGHAPAIVFADSDIDAAVNILSAAKFRNAGQVCVAPTRFLIQENVFEPFVDKFVKKVQAIKVGNGLEEGASMGPLANDRRLHAMEALLADAVQSGAEVRIGGRRIGNKGFFFEPTVVVNPSLSSRVMNEEPFGPLAIMVPFKSFDDAIEEANRLPYGLAAYAYTSSTRTAAALGANIECGMVTINHMGLGLPETPFGGIKDSGMGSEGGSEGIEAYLQTKFVSQM